MVAIAAQCSRFYRVPDFVVIVGTRECTGRSLVQVSLAHTETIRSAAPSIRGVGAWQMCGQGRGQEFALRALLGKEKR